MRNARSRGRAFCYKGPMRIIGLAGWSGSGKTTLVARLIPRLIERGIKVSTLKHAHHGFDLDQPGKDSFFHRAAGATEVIISSARRWAILHELREEPEWDLRALVAKMSPDQKAALRKLQDFERGVAVKSFKMSEEVLKPVEERIQEELFSRKVQ